VLFKPNNDYYIVFKDYDNTVKDYLGIRVNPESKGSSVLKLGVVGENKAKLVDYLNQSLVVLSVDMLELKKLFATKRIEMIDDSLAQKTVELSENEKEVNEFKNKNASYELEKQGDEISSRLTAVNMQKETVNRHLNYYHISKDYHNTHSDYRNEPPPS